MIPITLEQWLVYGGLVALGWFARHNGFLHADGTIAPPPAPPFLAGHPLAGEFYQFIADRLRSANVTTTK